MTVTVFDDRVCTLGEGPLWHPERAELFWFDIMGKRLMSKAQAWDFDEAVSAAGWVDRNTLLIASETQLLRFDLRDGTQTHICPLEADNPVTRSNDGRADPWGGFWISSMGKHAEPGAGAIYRWYRSELRQIAEGITVPNAICFCPIAKCAYYTDTPTRIILRQPLRPDTGWPDGPAEPFLDLNDQGYNPDGAVTDVDGNLWVALWEAARVVCYDRSGAFVTHIPITAQRTTCPVFGGNDLSDLYVTSAAIGLGDRAAPSDGQTFCAHNVGRGRPEPRVVL